MIRNKIFWQKQTNLHQNNKKHKEKMIAWHQKRDPNFDKFESGNHAIYAISRLYVQKEIFFKRIWSKEKAYEQHNGKLRAMQKQERQIVLFCFLPFTYVDGINIDTFLAFMPCSLFDGGGLGGREVRETLGPFLVQTRFASAERRGPLTNGFRAK